MKKSFVLSTVAAAFALLAGSSAANASVVEFGVPKVQPSLVTPGDTFQVDISGYNTAGTTGYLLVPDTTVTFGTTATAIGYGNQAITITSGETINGATTTDTVTISTPTNFLSAAKVGSTTIAALQMDIGDANAGGNTIDYALPVTGNTATGYCIYGTTNFTLAPVTTLTNSAMSLAAVEGVNAGGTSLYQFGFNTFSYSVTYNTIPTVVPEPSTWALCGLGLAGCAGVVLRRRGSKI